MLSDAASVRQSPVGPQLPAGFGEERPRAHSVSRRPPAASRLSQPPGNWPLLFEHREGLDGPSPDQRVPGDPIAVVAAGGRAVRRQRNREQQAAPNDQSARQSTGRLTSGWWRRRPRGQSVTAPLPEATEVGEQAVARNAYRKKPGNSVRYVCLRPFALRSSGCPVVGFRTSALPTSG